MPSAHVRAIKDWFMEGWNRGNLEVVDHVVASTCVEYGLTSGLVERMGTKGQKQAIEATRRAFPDLHMRIEETIPAGDRVIVRWSAAGTQRDAWMGLPATHQYMTWGGIAIYRFVGSKVQQIWWLADVYGALQQLGGIALTQEAGARG